MTTTLAVRAARNRRQNYRRALRARGEWNPFIDADIVREHITNLRSQGVTLHRICELSDTPRGDLTHLLYGSSGYPPARKMRTEIAERILAVQPTWDNIPDRALMPSTAAVRRLQALVAVGWPPPYLAAELGKYLTYLNRLLREVNPRITGQGNRAIASLYGRLWNKDPLDHGVDRQAKSRAQSRARRHGWALPAAWDDDRISDPKAQPDHGQQTPRYIALAEDCAELERLGHTREQIAARLGVTRDGLQRALSLYRKAGLGEAA
ncbi:hypothetical protein [Streptomyces racemochromogenes]|uniref:hypothetical protein n=1 Tax=Streptomyces racemochromogenes TaxID=67353 RepID=UPI0031E81809